ncbi:MAG: hypothetical protein P8Y03_00005, partial [Anaerolineales bacterium]
MIDYPLNSLDHFFISAITFFIQDPHTDQADAGSDAIPFPIGINLAVGDNASDVGAMTVRVVGRRASLYKIYPAKNAIFWFAL